MVPGFKNTALIFPEISFIQFLPHLVSHLSQATTSPQLPVFQDTKSFSAKSVHWKPHVSNHLSQKFLNRRTAVFSLKIDFSHECNIASALAHVASLGSYHILIRQNFY